MNTLSTLPAQDVLTVMNPSGRPPPHLRIGYQINAGVGKAAWQ